MSRPLHRCGRCGRAQSAWKSAGLCKGCQRDVRAELAASTDTESWRDFRKRVIERKPT